MKDQREQDYAADLDESASAVARRLIRESGLPDTTANWRALKAAYLNGHTDARR